MTKEMSNYDYRCLFTVLHHIPFTCDHYPEKCDNCKATKECKAFYDALKKFEEVAFKESGL